MEKQSDWATYGMKEYIFWRDGMTPDEYEIERAYYYGNTSDADGREKYQPIWKQRQAEPGVEITVDETWANPYMKGFDFWYPGIPLTEYEEKYKQYFKKLNKTK